MEWRWSCKVVLVYSGDPGISKTYVGQVEGFFEEVNMADSQKY